eukprot:m51a1_g14576 hypothetical protein (314) ;mRNA; f:1080323-1082653
MAPGLLFFTSLATEAEYIREVQRRMHPRWTVFGVAVYVVLLACITHFFAERMLRTHWLLRRQDVDQRKRIEEESMAVESLLNNLLPTSVVERLLRKRNCAIVDKFSDASEYVEALNRLFARLDDICSKHGVDKHNNLEAIALQCSIGIACGPVIAGVIGRIKFTCVLCGPHGRALSKASRYDVFGACVQLASRLCSCCPAGSVVISELFHSATNGYYTCEPTDCCPSCGKCFLLGAFVAGFPTSEPPGPTTRTELEIKDHSGWSFDWIMTLDSTEATVAEKAKRSAVTQRFHDRTLEKSFLKSQEMFSARSLS